MIERQATPWTEPFLQDLASAVLQLSTADATEVVLHAHTTHLTRFANNQIHQNVSEQTLAVTVRVVFGSQMGQSTTNNLDAESLAATVRSAEALARFAPENAEFPGLAPPSDIRHADAVVARTLDFSPADRARVVDHVCRGALAHDLNASGEFTTGVRQIAIANTHGLWAYQAHTLADFQTVVRGTDSSGWAADTHIDAGHIDGEALAAEAIDKALRSKDPGDLDPGVYPVLLEAYAVNDMMQYLAGGFSGEDVRQGRSFMSGRQGEPLVHPGVTVWDDGRDLAGVPWPFDWEGVPKQKVTFLEGGRVGEPVYDMRTAGLEGRASTGHYQAGGAFWGPGIAAWNLFMAPGAHSQAEMLETMERGIYVTRFHYVNRLDAKRTTITGMTRDGTFWVENGRIVRPLRNMRFTQSITDALADIEMIGDTTQLEQTFHGGGVRCPALRVKNFRFSGKTTF
jgi:predicted Zn-dependent protease